MSAAIYVLHSPFRLFAALLCVQLLLAGAVDARSDRAYNRIVIAIDSSGSYKNRQQDALAKASVMLGELEARGGKRGARPDEVIVIALDALPEIIWKGDRKALGSESRAAWLERFKGRTDYAACTDIEVGLELATRTLREDAAATKYLIAFTDLIHEPPKKKGRGCVAPKKPSIPGEEFDWSAFEGISTSVFWVPFEQKKAWAAKVKAAELSQFSLYTLAESASVKLPPPPPAKRRVDDQKREENMSELTSLAKWIAYSLGGVIAVALLFAGGMTLRRRAPAGAPRNPAPMAASALQPTPSRSKSATTT